MMDTLAPLVFLTVGAGMLALGATLLRKTLRFRQRAAKAVGIIIESKMWSSSAHRPGERETWDITVEFEDATGAKRQGDLRATDYRESRRYEVGAQVAILYDRERPSVIRFDSFIGVWFGNLVLLTLGAVFLVVGLLLWTVGLPSD